MLMLVGVMSARPEQLHGSTRTRNRKSVRYATPVNRADRMCRHETDKTNRSDVYSAGGSRRAGMLQPSILLDQVFPPSIHAERLHMPDIESV